MEEEEVAYLNLGKFISSLKSNARISEGKQNIPSRIWSENEVLDEKQVRAMVIVIKTSGCRWSKVSGCSMCGYFKESLREVSQEDLIKQMDFALSKYNGEKIIKIFTSGSFLDDKEINFSTQIKIMKKLSKIRDLKMVSIESRPEFVDFDKLRKLSSVLKGKDMEISIGLESANNRILKYSINKGINFSMYIKSSKMIKEADLRLKTYILLKPPFLTERESIEDAIRTIRKIRNVTDTISLNPTSVHRYTLVEYLWERGEYRPPWLWSVVEVLINGKRIIGEKRIKSDITGGGSRRGAHNCGRCDRDVMESIKRFSLSQNIDDISSLECECKEKWKDMIDLERFSMGSLVRLHDGCRGR